MVCFKSVIVNNLHKGDKNTIVPVIIIIITIKQKWYR